MNKPVLFLLFNRPDLAATVFEAIRTEKPPRLYLAVDGPREGRPDELVAVQECRQLANRVDWECQVETLFRDTNLGCGRAVSSAIDWFFENEEAGIILEDDCLPSPDFFRFVSDLLDYYQDRERIMFIGGTNHQGGATRSEFDYYFSKYSHVWGWGSWRRAWKNYDFDLKQWKTSLGDSWLEQLFENRTAPAKFWSSIFDQLKRGEIDTWDYQLVFSVWSNRGLAIIPETNLVSNIGFDERATHTTNTGSSDANRSIGSLEFPLSHPPEIQILEEADQFFEESYAGTVVQPASRLRRWIKKCIVKFVGK